ncbi:hypothetical protein C0993_002238 [Termitomyces sp. T159_Od127]|nr:hypothetical protein C0993_002238 [Termitomyces sp. T159_Od127]
MITTGSPPEAMKRILSVLENMGIVVEAEHEYRYRCTRPRRHADLEDGGVVSVLGNGHSKGMMSSTRPSRALEAPSPARYLDLGLEDDFEKSFTADFSSDLVDDSKGPSTTLSRDSVVSPGPTSKSSKPVAHSSVLQEHSSKPTTPDIQIHLEPAIVSSTSPSPPSTQPAPNSIPQENLVPPEPITIPRKSSHLLSHPTSLASSLDSDAGLVHTPSNNKSVAYGPRSEDPGDEVRFTTELTRLENLDTTYSLDIRRLKGNLRSYKFLYDTVREYVNSPDVSFLSCLSFVGQTRRPPCYNLTSPRLASLLQLKISVLVDAPLWSPVHFQYKLSTKFMRCFVFPVTFQYPI